VRLFMVARAFRYLLEEGKKGVLTLCSLGRASSLGGLSRTSQQRSRSFTSALDPGISAAPLPQRYALSACQTRNYLIYSAYLNGSRWCGVYLFFATAVRVWSDIAG